MSNETIKKLYALAYQKAKKDIEDKTMPYAEVLHIINNISNAYETHKMLSDKLDSVRQQVDDGIKALPNKVYGMLTWANIIDKPVQFPPTPHTHTWESIAGKPKVFNPMQHNIIDYHTVPANSNKDVPITDNGTLQLRRLRVDDIKDLDNRLTTIQETAGKGYVTIRGGSSGGGTALTVREADGTPSVGSVNTIVVSNGTLTDNGSGEVAINTTGGGGTSIDSGTSFPISPSLGDYFFRTDLGVLARYNGVDWDYYELPSTVMLTTTYDTTGDGVIDVAALPSVSSTNAGIIPSTSGASTGDVASVKADGTIEYVTPSGISLDTPNSFSIGVRTANSIEVTWSEYPAFLNLYRSDTEFGTYSKVATVPSPEASYTDTGLSENETYWYKALHVVGNSESSYTNSVSGYTRELGIVQTLIANGSSSVTFNLSSVQAGNLMIIGTYFRVDGNGTITVPTGWTNEVSNTDNTNASKSWALSRVKQSGDTSVTINYSGTGQLNSAILLEVKDASSTISDTSSANGASSPAVMSSVPNGETGDLLVCFNSAAITNNNEDAFSTPSGMTKQRISFETSAPYRHTVVLFTQTLASSGATGTRTSTISDMFTNSNFGWASLGLIVKPS